MNAKDPTEKVGIDDSAEPSGADASVDDTVSEGNDRPTEIGGRGGLDPTRYGDWEKNGRCIDF